MIFRFAGHHNFNVDWKLELIGATTSAIALGVVFSIVDIFINKTRIRQKSFGFILLVKSFIFSLAIISAIILTVFIVESVKGRFSIYGYFYELVDAFSSIQTLIYIFYSIIVSFIFYYHNQVNKKIGHRILLNLLLGRYHKPKEENRIIMFLDLTSATKIGEKLGAYKYSLFLKDFFFDIDDAINETKGTVSQFVGDEVMVIWDSNKGVEHNNCVRLFYLVEEKINLSKERYIEKYGFFPEFKAGIHYGKVIITQVGGTKQEIAYHGDTVNTTARIRSECNIVNEKLLISAELLSLMSDIDNDFIIESKGIFSLKGKDNVIGLFSIKKKMKSNDKN